jgi:hypothetical protein
MDGASKYLPDEGHGFWEMDHRTGLIFHIENWLDYPARIMPPAIRFWQGLPI